MTYTTESIKSLLESSIPAVERAMIVLLENEQYVINTDCYHVVHFGCYIQGWHFIDRKRHYEPKSLTNPHCLKAFVKSGVLQNHNEQPIDIARRIAINNIDILVAIANKSDILKPQMLIESISGRYKDTVTYLAVLNSTLNDYPEINEWPFKRKVCGKPTSNDYQSLQSRNKSLRLSEQTFLDNYTIIQETDCYTD